MTPMEAIALALTAIVIPYVVALIKGKTITGNAARWLAIGLSVLAGIVVAFVAGVPETPGELILCIFSAIGAVQAAYSIFKEVGITCNWLEALSAVRKDSDDVVQIQKNQALEDKAEEKVAKGTDDE